MKKILRYFELVPMMNLHTKYRGKLNPHAGGKPKCKDVSLSQQKIPLKYRFSNFISVSDHHPPPPIEEERTK